MYIGGGVVLLIVIIVVVILLLRRLPVRLRQDWHRACQRIGAGVRLVLCGRRGIVRVQQVEHVPDRGVSHPLIQAGTEVLEHPYSNQVVLHRRRVLALTEGAHGA